MTRGHTAVSRQLARRKSPLTVQIDSGHSRDKRVISQSFFRDCNVISARLRPSTGARKTCYSMYRTEATGNPIRGKSTNSEAIYWLFRDRLKPLKLGHLIHV